MTLFSGLGTDVHFSGAETGLQWEDYFFELKNAVEWRMVMSRGQDERSQEQLVLKLSTACWHFWPCKGARETRAQ